MRKYIFDYFCKRCNHKGGDKAYVRGACNECGYVYYLSHEYRAYKVVSPWWRFWDTKIVMKDDEL